MINVGKNAKMLNSILREKLKFLVWLFLNILILIYGIYLRSTAPDGAVIFIYLMYIISFPLGFLVPFVFVCIDKCIGYNINIYYNSYPILIDIVIPWILFLIVGYIQWFALIPKATKWWKNKA